MNTRFRRRKLRRKACLAHMITLWAGTMSVWIASHGAAVGAAVTVRDNFNDNRVNRVLWETNIFIGVGAMQETNKHLEYVCATPGGDNEGFAYWEGTRLGADRDWSVEVKLSNTAEVTNSGAGCSIGLLLQSDRDFMDSITAELYDFAFSGLPSSRGFQSHVSDAQGHAVTYDAQVTNVTAGSLKVSFASATKTVTVAYETRGRHWTPFATVNIDGTNGNSVPIDWGVQSSNRFLLYVYAFSRGLPVQGEMFADDFKAAGGTVERPTGLFRFTSLTNGPGTNALPRWSFDLNLQSRTNRNREQIVGSCSLTLPDSTTIVFKERPVRYSLQGGYNIAFARGTASTPVVDRTSSILIRGLKLARNHLDDWTVLGGTIRYNLAGQRGAADLEDFRFEVE